MKHLLFILLSVHFCFAQNVFEGHLVDAKSKAPIAFGHFSFEKYQGFISDENGRFKLIHPTKEIEVKVSAIGYQNKTTRITAGQKPHFFNPQNRSIRRGHSQL